MRGFAITLCGLYLILAGSVRADDALPPDVLNAIKAATVFVKVDASPLAVSGSGFLIKIDGGAGYIVTNHHVISPRSHSDHGRRVIAGTSKPKISVVFGSGTKNEESYRAEAITSDSERDLAILKVSDAKNLPRPLDLTQKATVSETTPVYVFGFPFGAALSENKQNPAVTVGRGSVSSLRNDDQGNLAGVQIDGALNPGNSGGPVVDSKGRLVGISVAAILGANIGLAIPSAELSKMLSGRVGAYHLSTAEGANGASTVSVTLDLVDPMNKLQAVVFHFIPTDALKDSKTKEGIGRLGQGRILKLKIDGQHAIGNFAWKLPEAGQHSITFQAAYMNGDGKLQYTPLHAYDFRDAPTPPVVAGADAPPHAGKPAIVEGPHPAGKPAAGKIHGLDFAPDHATLSFGILEFTGKDPSFTMVVFFPRAENENVSNKAYTSEDNTQISVHAHWKYDDGRRNGNAWSKGFKLKLNFGNVVHDRVPASISVQLPDTEETFLQGTFDVEVRR